MLKSHHEHNHLLSTPSKKRILPVNRKIEPFIRSIGPTKQFSYIANQCGGFENCRFTRIDFNNLRRDDLKNIKKHGIDILIEKFSALKEENSDFYYSYVLDNEVMKNILIY